MRLCKSGLISYVEFQKKNYKIFLLIEEENKASYIQLV